MGKHGGKREGAGRKRTCPSGSKPKCIKMTDEEFIAVKEYLKRLRAGEDFDGAIFHINMQMNIKFA